MHYDVKISGARIQTHDLWIRKRVYQVRAPMFPLILVTIGQIVKKWQQFFEIQDRGGRHLELWLLGFFDVADVFLIKVAIFPLNLAMIDQILNKFDTKLFFEIQDGGNRLLEFLQLCISDVIDMFQIETLMRTLILIAIAQIAA